MKDQFCAQSVDVGSKPSPVQSPDDIVRWAREKRIAEIFGLSVPWLRRARWEGNGPAFAKLGNQVLYEVAIVEEWLKERLLSSTSESDNIAAVSRKRRESRKRNKQAS